MAVVSPETNLEKVASGANAARRKCWTMQKCVEKKNFSYLFRYHEIFGNFRPCGNIALGNCNI